MPSKVHQFKVEMTCEGCSGAVQRVLGKLIDKGVDGVNISLSEQLVEVTSSLESTELLEHIKKTGKTTTYLGEKK